MYSFRDQPLTMARIMLGALGMHCLIQPLVFWTEIWDKIINEKELIQFHELFLIMKAQFEIFINFFAIA